MCVELCSAKLLTPIFGTSIYIWASVLGITLTALMSGYYLGGYLSSKQKNAKTMYWLMLIGGLLLSLTPFISELVLPITVNLGLISGSIISLICFLFFPLVLFGATSPLLINILTSDNNTSGKSSGTVYAISTFGGIVTTFLVGFYTLPEFGITKTLYTYGILVMTTALSLFIYSKSKKLYPFLIILIGILSFNFQNKISDEVIYFSEGILGEVKVVDRILFNENEGQMKTYRQLIVNNISQTIMDKNDPEKSYWDYVDILTYNINLYAKNKETLLLGLGGGTLFKTLNKNGYKIEVVELDERIANLAKEYFHIDSSLNVIIDDARHYLNISNKKYDVIIYDLFQAETPPIHIMTKEAFENIKKNLTPDGILVVNFYGFITGEKGKAARSVYKTLLKSGYNVRLMGTSNIESKRNLLFMCSNKELKANDQIIHPIVYEMDINFDDALILSDDKPILEHLYAEAAMAWRREYNEFNTKYYLQKDQWQKQKHKY
ncbi:MAG: fused MFS/spermidine synthase [Vicingaceae bacterium]|nr:fused MFS/spermidine synthase [Vicingaceae bacterium]